MKLSINLINAFRCLAKDVDLDPYSTGYLLKRLRCEGTSFATSTLRNVSSAVITGLETGWFDRSKLTSFAWKGGLLRCFEAYLIKIFDARTGKLLSNPCALSIYLIRQVCEYAYKLAVPFDEQELDKAEKEFVKTDLELASPYDEDWVEQLAYDLRTAFPKLANIGMDEIFRQYPPRNGPGTFSERSSVERCMLYEQGLFYLTFLQCVKPCIGFQYMANARFQKVEWFHLNHQQNYGSGKFPEYGWAVAQDRIEFGVERRETVVETLDEGVPCLYSRCEEVEIETYLSSELQLSPYEPDYSEVLFVPKDSRGPRVIVREPREALAFQMAYFDFMSDTLTELTNGHINFQDQQVNRRLALEGSLKPNSWATLDLSSASDRVSYRVIEHLFKYTPGLADFASRRTTRAKLPSGKMIELNKFAGMGSGYTFPTMALLIYLTCVRAIYNLSSKTYSECMNCVYVYGDDIIVPVPYVEGCMEALRKVLLVPNADKSFHRGRFRESCGGDYYDGQEVVPVKLRLSGSNITSQFPKIKADCDLFLLQLERHCRELVKAGLLSLSSYYYKRLETRLGRLPDIFGESPAMGRYSILPVQYGSKDNGFGEYDLVRAVFPVPVESKVCFPDPYRFIDRSATRIGQPADFDWIDLLYPEGGSMGYGVTGVPNLIKFRYQRVSAFRLMG